MEDETIMEDEPVVSVENFCLNYRTKEGILRALRNVDLTIKRGEILGLVGESGSGKSTVAFSIVGHIPDNAYVSEGRILFLGQDTFRIDPEKLRKIRSKNIAMVYQDPMSSLNPSLTVGFQIAEIIRNHQKVDKNTAWRKSVNFLEQVHIPDPEASAYKYQHQMSGGQMQRVVIAMALCRNPDLLIMDEPTTGLDVTTEATILDLVNELKSQFNSAILFITHNLGVIAKVADKVGVLYAGQMVEKGRTSKIFQNPLHPYTMALINSIPSIIGEKKKGLRPIGGMFPDLTIPYQGCIFFLRCPYREDRCREDKVSLNKFNENRETACLRWDIFGSLKNEIRRRYSYEETPSYHATSIYQSEENSILTLKHVKKYYGSSSVFSRFTDRKNLIKAVDNISLSIYENDVLGVVGESGCGKSTLATVINKLQKLTDGSIMFRGKDLWRMSKSEEQNFRQECQIVFQNPDSSLNPKKSISEILERPLVLFNYGTGKQRKKRIHELLNMVNMETRFEKNYPYQLSGGEKQRIGIARAFAVNPKFVICDEILSALDVSVQAAILNLLIELQRKFETSYLFISHDLSVVRHISKRVCVMYLGKICEIGFTDGVFSPPFHPYTEALLSAVPTIDMNNKEEEIIRLEGPVPSAKNPPSGCAFHTRCPRKIGDICEHKQPEGNFINDFKIIYCHLYN